MDVPSISGRVDRLNYEELLGVDDVRDQCRCVLLISHPQANSLWLATNFVAQHTIIDAHIFVICLLHLSCFSLMPREATEDEGAMKVPWRCPRDAHSLIRCLYDGTIRSLCSLNPPDFWRCDESWLKI